MNAIGTHTIFLHVNVFSGFTVNYSNAIRAHGDGFLAWRNGEIPNSCRGELVVLLLRRVKTGSKSTRRTSGHLRYMLLFTFLRYFTLLTSASVE
ncbi:hypothetical protein VTO42DRAFT_4502 [Malbranchea cinnamomea]